MDPKSLSPKISVSAQIAPEDITQIAEAGFTTIICNRPNSEVPAPLQAATMAELAKAAGLNFVFNPVVHTGITDEIIACQKSTIDESEGPVFAYCQSGTRCTVLWMLSEAATTPADELIKTASDSGFQLSALKPQLDARFKG